MARPKAVKQSGNPVPSFLEKAGDEGKKVTVNARIEPSLDKQFRMCSEAAKKRGFSMTYGKVIELALINAIKEYSNAFPDDMTGDLFAEDKNEE